MTHTHCDMVFCQCVNLWHVVEMVGVRVDVKLDNLMKWEIWTVLLLRYFDLKLEMMSWKVLFNTIIEVQYGNKEQIFCSLSWCVQAKLKPHIKAVSQTFEALFDHFSSMNKLSDLISPWLHIPFPVFLTVVQVVTVAYQTLLHITALHWCAFWGITESCVLLKEIDTWEVKATTQPTLMGLSYHYYYVWCHQLTHWQNINHCARNINKTMVQQLHNFCMT